MGKIFIGVAGIPLCIGKKDYFKALKVIKELNLDALEVEFVYGIDMSSNLAKSIGNFAKKLGIRLSVHAPYYINLCSERKKVISDSKRRIVETLIKAHELKANIVVIHAAYYGTYGPSRCYELVKSSLKEIEEEVKKLGIKDVKIGIETLAKKTQFGTLEEIVKLCKEINIAVPCIDWAHVYIRNFGRIDYGKILDIIERELKLKELHTHFTCIKRDERGALIDEHDILDKDTPPFKPLIEELLKRELEVTIICESPLLEKDALKMKKIVKELEDSIFKINDSFKKL